MKNNKKKIIGILFFMLMIAATVLPVTGNMNKAIDEEYNVAFLDDFIQSSGKEKKPIDINFDKDNLLPVYGSFSRDILPVPEYEFIKNPTTITSSYYDYMPGSYSNHPIRLQTENGDGHYITFFGQSGPSTTRRQYWAYMDSDGNLIDYGLVTSYDTRQGYGGIDIHPATGDCIASWHENLDGGLYETALTYDDFDAAEVPDNWQDPLSIPATENREYIWPSIYVGPSPLEDYVRVYQITNDYTNLPSGDPCEDVRIMYTDIENVNGVDVSNILDIADWSTVTVMTDWRPTQVRPYQSFAIDFNNPGKVAFIGYASYLRNPPGGDEIVDEGAFVWESYDYGETWSYDNFHTHTVGPGGSLYLVDNIPGFVDENNNILDFIEVDVAGYHNTALYDSDGILHWTFMQSYGFTGADGLGYYFPDFMPQAEMTWDGGAFFFHEVPELPGQDPLSGHSVPWDETNLYTIIGWNTYPSDIFHQNTQKQAINIEKGWMVQMWADGTFAQLAADGEYDQNYTEHPIIYLSVSNDNGNTWSEPINLTDIYSELFDFSEQITVFPYICDKIVDLGNNWGQIYMYYFNDNDFGSYPMDPPGGPNTGGEVIYCSLKIKFPDPITLTVDANGPYCGSVGEGIQFKGSAAGGVTPYSWLWDFGDGSTSTAKSPNYHYIFDGNYTVTLTVTDSEGNSTTDTTTATITPIPPHLEIVEIRGGLGVNAIIKNIGDTNLTDVDWNIMVNGGIFGKINKTMSDTISVLAAGENETVSTGFVYGLGLVDIKVTAEASDIITDTKEADGIVIFLFTIVK